MTTFSDHIADLQQNGRLRPFPRNPAYLVCDDGRVVNYRRTAWLRPCILKSGSYHAVALWTEGRPKTWHLHKLVALTFHGEPPTPLHHAAHDSGDKADNSATNVIWKTKLENEADKVRHGRTNRGERNGMASLSDQQAVEIRAAAAVGTRGIQAKLARQYGVSAGAISNIVNGKRRSQGGI